MRVLIAIDKFKGSLSATVAAQIIADAFRAVDPDVEIDLCPIADGGEGTAEALVTAQNGSWVEVETWDAQNRPVTARYGLMDQKEAVMEMSAASGLAMVSDLPLDPATASTYGTGLMLLDAMKRVERAIIGIGGSATNDGGAGMARALGFRFLDMSGDELQVFPRDLDRLENIIPPTKAGALTVLVACDVNNPLLGESGCTQVYGPQKGVRDFEFFESRLTRLAAVVKRGLGVDARDIPGAGAAGGLGFGLMSFCGAKLVSGFDLIAESVRLHERTAAADLVITGEGKMDAQTLHGKGPLGVADMARALGKPVAALAGVIEDRELLQTRFDFLHQVKPESMPIPEAIAKARECLAMAAGSLALEQSRLFRAGDH